jgi:hypothetical protein
LKAIAQFSEILATERVLKFTPDKQNRFDITFLSCKLDHSTLETFFTLTSEQSSLQERERVNCL